MVTLFAQLSEAELSDLLQQKDAEKHKKSYKNCCQRFQQNSVVTKYRDLSVVRRSIICLRHRQIIDLLAIDKSRYFAHNCDLKHFNRTYSLCE